MACDIPSATALAAAALLFGVACGRSEPAPPETPDDSEEAPLPEASEPPALDPAARCAASIAETDAAIEAVVEAHRACVFDVECVQASRATACGDPCDAAIHPAGLGALREARAAADERCADFEADGCSRAAVECARATPRCGDGRCLMDEGDAPLRDVPVPDANRAGQAAPPARPSPGEAEQARAARLLRAIVEDEPRLAQDFFFPREAFRRVKAIGDPDRYWTQLFERYAADIHALHEQLEREGVAPDGERAEFVALDVIRRGGWVPRGEEANALPYWVSRHSRLRYRVGGEERSFEVRVLITWGERWYVTHLSEFR